MTRRSLLMTCLVVVSACDKKEDAKAAAPAPAPAAAPAPSGKGIDAPGNDPKIVGLAKKVLTCKWDGATVASDCPDFKAWEAERDAFADNKADATLVAFIEDSDVRVRDLGLRRFSPNSGKGAVADKAMSERLVAAAEHAKGWPEHHAYLIGYIVGRIKIGDSGLFPRIKTLVSSPEVDSSMRRSIIDSLLSANDQSDEVWALTHDTIKDPDKLVGRNALRAFWMGGTDKTMAARCDVYKENLENPDEDFSSAAVEYLTRRQAGCRAHLDAALTLLEARVKAKKVTVAPLVDAIANVCDPEAGSPAQVKKANGLAHQLADDKKGQGWARAAALEAALKCDPKGGKAYVGKFKKDADPEVKAKATQLLAKK